MNLKAWFPFICTVTVAIKPFDLITWNLLEHRRTWRGQDIATKTETSYEQLRFISTRTVALYFGKRLNFCIRIVYKKRSSTWWSNATLDSQIENWGCGGGSRLGRRYPILQVGTLKKIICDLKSWTLLVCSTIDNPEDNPHILGTQVVQHWAKRKHDSHLFWFWLRLVAVVTDNSDVIKAYHGWHINNISALTFPVPVFWIIYGSTEWEDLISWLMIGLSGKCGNWKTTEVIEKDRRWINWAPKM